MGLFYCVQAGCAQVQYKPYEIVETNLIRYRYPGKDWVEIEADDYVLEDGTNEVQTYTYDKFIKFTSDINSGGGQIYTDVEFVVGTFGNFINEYEFREQISETRFAKACVKFRNPITGVIATNCVSTRSSNSGFISGTQNVINIEQDTFTFDRCSFSCFLNGENVFLKISEEIAHKSRY